MNKTKPQSTHHALYNNPRWIVRRRQQLQKQPLCQYCLLQGYTVPATVADHITPHKGDLDLFWHGALQSLSKHCHDKFKYQIEKHGHTSRVDVHGAPLEKK
jgi:5-methylcytosine-specific restriction endonuclease McrA